MLRKPGALAHEWGHALDSQLGWNAKPTGFKGAMQRVGSAVKGETNSAMASDPATSGWAMPHPELREAWNGVQAAMSPWKQRYGNHDPEYSSHPKEMFARAFAGFVRDKLAMKGQTNSFLVDTTQDERHHPRADEQAKIDIAMDQLFATIKKRRVEEWRGGYKGWFWIGRSGLGRRSPRWPAVSTPPFHGAHPER